MSSASIVIGLDPSLTGFGLCILDTATGEIRTKRVSTEAEGVEVQKRFGRYFKILDEVLQFAALAPETVAGVFLEGYAYAAKGRATVSLGEFGGLLRYNLLELYGEKLHEVSPSAAKKFATGRGQCKPFELCVSIAKKLDREFPSEDEYTAVALALFGSQQLGLPS